MMKVILFCLFILVGPFSGKSSNEIILSSQANNDLYITLKNNNIPCRRFDNALDAINYAENGSGVMILADGYPHTVTEVDLKLIELAKSKRIRLFIEFPSFIPDVEMSSPRSTHLERVVVATDLIHNLKTLQIIEIHDCHYVPVNVPKAYLVLSKVAGFDRAEYGLDSSQNNKAVLFEQEQNDLLISTTKLSHFLQARYAPKKSIQSVLVFILNWVSGSQTSEFELSWTPTVRPTYTKGERLPQNAERESVQNGMDWYHDSKMLLSVNGWEEYRALWNLSDSNMFTTVPTVNTSGDMPKSSAGDGRFGVLEGIVSKINFDGSQPTRWWLRSDANGESSLAFALRWAMDGHKESKVISQNLLNWVYFKSGLFQADPQKANYGLIFWAPGNAQALYQDNDVKTILGCIGTSSILQSDRWDEVLLKNILGNFRTTGVNGFRGWRLENPDLVKNGWRHYWKRNTVQLQPHYEAWTWASYLWLYNQTRWEPLFERTLTGIKMMMEAYPDDWRWTNGIQQERGRMLLTLAWLIRIDDRPMYRLWLKRLATDMERLQDSCGAIREELGKEGKGDMAPPSSNEDYGKGEAPLIQKNGDAVADILYTCNFSFLGLHEAYAATGDQQYKRMCDKLADFLVRAQVKSEKHRNLNGGWFRAFDFNQWEYLGSNADSGWGAWAIETGWTQAWIPTVLAMRVLNKNLWDISRNSKIDKNFKRIQQIMIPHETL